MSEIIGSPASLASVVGTKRPKPSAELVFVTPETAAEWLEHNDSNRNQREGSIAKYARSIANEDWLITGEGVKFDWNGRLVDGQHRLKAIVKAGVGAWMFVFRHLNPDVQAVLDTGIRRTPGDALKWAGYPSFNELATMARLLILWDEGYLRRSGANASREVANEEILAWAAEHSERALHWYRKARSIENGKSGFPTVSRCALAAALFLLDQADPCGETVNEFAERLRTIRLSGTGDPVNALHARLLSARANRERLYPASQFYCYFRVWNALIDGESLRFLKIGRTGNRDNRPSDIGVPMPKRPGCCTNRRSAAS